MFGNPAEEIEHVRTELARRPADENLAESILQVAEHRWSLLPEQAERERMREQLQRNSPDVLACRDARTEAIRSALTDALAVRLGVDARHDPRPRMLASVVFSAVDYSVNESLRAGALPTSNAALASIRNVLRRLDTALFDTKE